MKPIKYGIKLTLAFLLFTVNLTAQTTQRQYQRWQQTGSGLEVYVSDGKYKIDQVTNKIVHVTFEPADKVFKNFSYAVDLNPKKVDFTVNEKEGAITLETSGITTEIRKAPFNISYYYKGKLLLGENNGYHESDSSRLIDFNITETEVLYGGGARALGMNRRGNRLMLYNRAHYGYETHSELMNYTLPIIMSSRLYTVLFDNAGLGFLDLDSRKNNTISYETYSGIPNYHVIAADNWFDLVGEYTLLTGRQPLPPRWTFGNFSSRFGYHSQKEVENTVDKFFKDKIPLDAVIIDIYWFGKEIKGEMGNLRWYTDSFPSPEKMISKFAKKGVKTILVTEPFILTTSSRWQEVVEKDILAKNDKGEPYTYDFYFGNTGLIDIYKPEAREWFWNIYKELTLQGISGWWGDLGEPEVHPADIIHAVGTGNEIHNAYGHEWAKLIFEGYKKDFPDVRPFILMRAGYAGSQRYGMIPWSGDVNRSSGGLVSQPEIALQMGMQGLGYMHSDLGGFAGGDSIDDELYVRWLQYGVFQPVFRPHAQEHIPAEPVFQAHRTKLFATDAINLRYRLLPYNYSLAFKNSTTGRPFMTPLFFHDNNKELLDYDSCYMWGDAFLVSPVKKQGAMYQEVYLPKGNLWIDYFTNTAYQGGRVLKYPVSMSNIPVFVKGGSFVPMTVEAKSTTYYDLKNFEMHYFVDPQAASTSYELYNDDGITPDSYGKGKYEIINFAADNHEEQLTISIKKVTTDEAYSKVENKVKLCVHNLSMRPSKVTVNNKVIGQKNMSWNPVTNKLMLEVSATITNSDIVITK